MAGATVTKPVPAPQGARPIRVLRGAQPTYAGLTPYQQWAWRLFRDRVTREPPDLVLEEKLVQAHMRIRPEEYLAVVLLSTILAAVAMSIAGVVIGYLLAVSVDLYVGIGIGLVLPLAGTFGVNFLLKQSPASRASAREKDINKRLSPSMSFVAAMASADVNVDQIFKELARQKIYGEVAEEAAWITRDTDMLGVDILTAIRNGAQRTPSKRFQDFLQGVVTTATSGGQLKPYFLLKAEQYEKENKLETLRRIETMGLFAETYVTAVVAFPLFLVIVIAIFAIIGGGGGLLIELLWIIVALMVPAFQIMFIYLIYGLAQEV